MVKVYQPGSIVEQIYSLLCQEIMDGTLTPGQLLKEQEMTKRFGISRAPIREAIRLLEAEGMIVVSAYKRKFVRKITHDDLQEVIPVLACLEGCAAKLASERINLEQIIELTKINNDLKFAYQARNIEACVKLNFRFHAYYVKRANNKALKQAIRPIIQRIVSLWVTSLYKLEPTLFEMTIEEHNKLLESFAHGDSKQVEQSARDHIENLLSRVMGASVFDKHGNFKFT